MKTSVLILTVLVLFSCKPLSSYCPEEWVEQVAKVVESEIYHVNGENNARAFSNVSLGHDNIKTEFYAKMKD